MESRHELEEFAEAIARDDLRESRNQEKTETGGLLNADEAVWASVLSAIPNVEAWNRNLEQLIQLKDQYGPACREYIKAEVERRGYLWSSESHCYVHPWWTRAVKGKSVIGVSWRNGVLRVASVDKNGYKTWWESEAHDVPFKIAENLSKHLYPDGLWWSKYSKQYSMKRSA